MKEKTEKNPGVAATRRLGVSRYAKDRLARLAAMRDAPGVAFEDRDAIDWAIRLATQAAERVFPPASCGKETEEHGKDGESPFLRRMEELGLTDKEPYHA
jgi:hypothetical protein